MIDAFMIAPCYLDYIVYAVKDPMFIVSPQQHPNTLLGRGA